MSAATSVLFLWDAPPPLRQYLADGLADRPGVALRYADGADEAALEALAADAEVLVGWRPSRAVLDAARDLRLFINPGVGVQHLLPLFRDLARDRPVRLANGHGNTAFTAQHAVALLLALTNRVVPHHGWMAAGRWRTGDAEAKSIPLRGRHVGLLGYGAVNRKVHRNLCGFDVRFSALRRSWEETNPEDPPDLARYAPDGLADFLRAVDVLVVAVPLTAETEGLIGRDELALLGPEGLLVNVARGPVIDEAALYRALAGGAIAGAALDVWYDYRPEPDDRGRRYPYAPAHPFHELPNVVLSPHRAASPFDDLGRWDEVIENIRRVADGRTDLLNLVDLERGY